MPDPLISFVIPVYDEVESLGQLAGEIRSVAESHSLPYEIILVDDGSRDGSWPAIEGLAAGDARIRGLRFRRNTGKAAALDAGFSEARGDIAFQLDADLQDDPAEVPHFLAKLAEGFEVVNGWKRVRHDPWHKVWPSRVFNRMVSRLTGLRLHDHNCGFKCFRAEVVKEIQLYGELHRFIPVIAHARGYRVAEIEVRHRPRRYGRSKYGVRRFLKGFLDLMTISFLTGFGSRPLHLLGGIGLAAFLLGAAGLGYLAICWVLHVMQVAGYGPIGQRPLLIYSVAAVLLGFQMLAIGFLAELIIAMNERRGHHYSIAERTRVVDAMPPPAISETAPCTPAASSADPSSEPCR
jgi:glycosyltransferase involved in cell wall biosynthesis